MPGNLNIHFDTSFISSIGICGVSYLISSVTFRPEGPMEWLNLSDSSYLSFQISYAKLLVPTCRKAIYHSFINAALTLGQHSLSSGFLDSIPVDMKWSFNSNTLKKISLAVVLFKMDSQQFKNLRRMVSKNLQSTITTTIQRLVFLRIFPLAWDSELNQVHVLEETRTMIPVLFIFGVNVVLMIPTFILGSLACLENIMGNVSELLIPLYMLFAFVVIVIFDSTFYIYRHDIALFANTFLEFERRDGKLFLHKLGIIYCAKIIISLSGVLINRMWDRS